MKKRPFFASLIFVLFIGLFLTGCASNNFVFDRSIKEENSCILKLSDDYMVVKFDDKKVKWKTSSFGLSKTAKKNEATVKIPAGVHTLIVDYISETDFGTYKIKRKVEGIEVKYNFEAGSTYSFYNLIINEKMTLYLRKK
jgi:hypothetical protein